MRTTRSIMLVCLMAALTVLFTAPGLFAQDQPGPPEQPAPPNPLAQPGERRFDPAQMFDRMDQNKDGKIAKDEFRGPEDRFTEADTNKDGFLSKEEFEKMPRPQRPEGPGAPGAPGGPNQGQMMDRFAERIKETLGSTDEEWKAIKPLVTKVLEARMKTNMGGFRGRRGGEQSSANTAADALNKALDAKASSDEIKLKLTAYRDQQKKNEEELKAAREALRKVLTINQEAHLVLMGILD